MSINNVALIGGTGTLGVPVLDALRSSPFTVHVLNRASSKSTYPNTSTITVPDDLDVSKVAKLLKDNAIDALVIAIEGYHVDAARRLIEAAFNAGVKRIIPPDFGSCDSADEKTNEVLPLMKGKKGVRDYLIELSGKDREGGVGKLTWTTLITGHFFDFGLTCGLLNFDVRKRKAYILDGGDIKFSNSTLPFIANAVVRILQKPEETANRVLYIHSLRVTQNELLAVLEKVTGERFEKIEQKSDEELAKSRPKMLDGDKDAGEEVVAVWGIVATDWEGREGLANDLLGLKEDDLEDEVRNALKQL
jgi:uncharacterized protein YbjT (DUF2867 family)